MRRHPASFRRTRPPSRQLTLSPLSTGRAFFTRQQLLARTSAHLSGSDLTGWTPAEAGGAPLPVISTTAHTGGYAARLGARRPRSKATASCSRPSRSPRAARSFASGTSRTAWTTRTKIEMQIRTTGATLNTYCRGKAQPAVAHRSSSRLGGGATSCRRAPRNPRGPRLSGDPRRRRRSTGSRAS